MKTVSIVMTAVIVNVLLVASPASAQVAMTRQLEARFAAADKNHDGKLTRAEAEAGMPRVAANFDKIDTTQAGYVTLDQVKQAASQSRK